MSQELGDGIDGELNLQSLNDSAAVEDNAGDQAAELERLKARMAELQAQTGGASAAAPVKAEGALQKQPSSGAGDPTAEDQQAKEEADGRSVYVGNVDYETTPEELQMHFQSCGTVNRVTILTDKYGAPKGFAYIEFLEADAVTAACLLADSEIRGRAIKVSPKRTNVPGLKQRGRGGRGAFGGPPRGRGFGGRRGGYSPYGGYAPYGGGFRGRRGRGGYGWY